MVRQAGWLVGVATAGVLMLAPGAGAQQLVNEACPHLGLSPNPSCTNQAVAGEGWTVAAITRPDAAGLARYRALIQGRLGRFYRMPKDPMIAFLGTRLDVPGDFAQSDADPKQGYMESSVMLRVANPIGGEEGWFPLATPVNDKSQYDAGRYVGLPKWMSDVTIAHNRADDSWTTLATKAGNKAAEFERITWLPETASRPAPATDPALKRALQRFIFFDDPMFSTVQGWDAPDDEAGRYSERVKFTLSSYVPDDGPAPAPASPYTTRGTPRFGTSTVSISDVVGPESLPVWRDLLPKGTQRLPGMFVNLNGYVLISSERADGKPGAGGTVTPTFPGPDFQAGAPAPGGGGPTPGPASSPPATSACRDAIAPRTTFNRRALRLTRRGLRLFGRSADRGCGALHRVRVAIALERRDGRCRHLSRKGRLLKPEPCNRPVLRTVRGTTRWRSVRRAVLAPGRYRVTVIGEDTARNTERPVRGRNVIRLRVR